MGWESLMRTLLRRWWRQALVQQKVWAVLLLVLVPLIGALILHVTLVNQLLGVQQQRHQVVLAREQCTSFVGSRWISRTPSAATF